MRNDLTPFRTVRELLANSDCVLMGNAVDTEGKLYADSVENLTAIFAMQDSYIEMLAACEAMAAQLGSCDDYTKWENAKVQLLAAIAKAKGA